VSALTSADLLRAAKATVHPEGMVFVIVGDRQKIEPALKELNLGEIRLLDQDGKPIAK
jgi:predicted Zn-dependent peptidase